MSAFNPIPLSSSGRPIFLEDEVEIRNEDGVSVTLQGNKKVIGSLFTAGLLVLTNYRLITIIESEHRKLIGWGIGLEIVETLEDCSSFLKSSKRLNMRITNHEHDIGLRFDNHHGKDGFLTVFLRALEKKSWLSMPVSHKVAASQPAEPTFSAANAGVCGIIRRQEKNMESVDSLAKNALTDLDALMKQAKEVITVVQRYASYSAGESAGGGAGGGGGSEKDSIAGSGASVSMSGGGGSSIYGSDDSSLSETTSQAQERNEMETIMQSIGIVSPVTKFSAGRLYHKQLARQMADLLLQQRRLERLGGMVTLTDLYCLFNRARGTELVSPEDMLKAAQLTGRLKLGVSLQVFESGVKVLRLDSFSEDGLSEKLLDLLRRDAEYSVNGLQAADVAVAMNVSLVVAKEQLLLSEHRGFLCRDESIDGLFFFPNFFNKFCASSIPTDINESLRKC